MFKSIKDKFFAPKQTGKKTLVVVDDDEKICVLLKNILKENPEYEIIGEAHDGDEAVELYKLTKPDAIILDIKMPRFDGKAALENILEYNGRAKVIALSAFTDRKTIVETIKAGAVNFITKPITEEQLLETLHETFYGYDDDDEQIEPQT